MKNTLYICTEDDKLYTLETLENEFNSYSDGNMTFEEFIDAATDMGGSLREIMSIRHYLYMIDFYVESAEKDYFVPFQEAVLYHQI